MSFRLATVHAIAGLQWFTFMFTNTVVIPISIGAAFDLNAHTISGIMARAFILTGIACLVQALFGHRLPLMEGQSGLWWSVILSLAAIGSGSPLQLSEIGGNLALGIMIGGIIVAALGAAGFHQWLGRLFTPVVMAVLLILLSTQLITIFFHGMLGISQGGPIHPGIAALSLAIAVLVGSLTLFGRRLWSNFAILIGLTVGWVAYVFMFGSAGDPVAVPTWRDITQPFAFGALPGFGGHLRPGLVITAIFTALMNTTNTIATLRAAEPLFSVQVPARAYRRSLLYSGLLTAVSGICGQVPYAPYTSSIGFLRTTRLLERTPFLIGAGLFAVFGFIPQLSGLFATLPYSVGASVLFIAYLQLFGAALQNLDGMTFNFRTVYRIALPVLVGLALQCTDTAAFNSQSPLIRPLLSNGMLVGILISILLENLLPWQKWANTDEP